MPTAARLLLTALLATSALPALADGFRVVVHPDNPAASLGRAQVSQLLLKKQLRWPDGTPVQPVEPSSEALRREVAESVHQKSLNAVKAYWNQQIFSGRDVPPLERLGDAEVLAYVRANRGAIGYVSAGADLAGAKAVDLTP